MKSQYMLSLLVFVVQNKTFLIKNENYNLDTRQGIIYTFFKQT